MQGYGGVEQPSVGTEDLGKVNEPGPGKLRSREHDVKFWGVEVWSS